MWGDINRRADDKEANKEARWSSRHGGMTRVPPAKTTAPGRRNAGKN